MQTSDLDISGKLTIKVRLGDDVRRVQILNEAITYDELLLMLQRVFRGKVNESDDITVKYKDEDGDLITIDNNADLCLAIRNSPVLKLEIFGVADKASSTSLDLKQLTKLKKEVQEIRDRANHILDSIDLSVQGEQSLKGPEGKGTIKQQPSKVPEAKEFDPLQKKDVSNGVSEVKEERREATPVAPGFDRPPSAQSHYPTSTQQQQSAGSYHQNVHVPPTQTSPQQQHSVSQYSANISAAAPTHQSYPGLYTPAQSYQSMPAGYPAMSYSMQSQHQQQQPDCILPYSHPQQRPPKVDFRQGDMGSNPYSKQMPPPGVVSYRPPTQYQ